MTRKLRITIEEKEYEVLVEDITPYEGRGRTSVRKVVLPDASLQDEHEEIRISPHNGVIVEIFVTEGQMVEKGEKLMAIEAMKIINTITSHRQGKITNIEVLVNQTVYEGQKLLTIQS
ncbi:MAG: acetyl-CoA carboxylase biotin carboxyl carrier protein subunit [Magnetococcales bacterium]|nr:acetyl-CoA carboxylase biotin carboxyl carrier protein subunit [Magnetococcales bacterium]